MSLYDIAVAKAICGSGGGGSNSGYDVIINAGYNFGDPCSFVKGSFATIHDALASDNPMPVSGCFVFNGYAEDDYEGAFCSPFRQVFLGNYGTEAYVVSYDKDDNAQMYTITANGITPEV